LALAVVRVPCSNLWPSPWQSPPIGVQALELSQTPSIRRHGLFSGIVSPRE
jgi:hypothetical protein